MNNIENLTQIEDESTEVNFVDSDYLLDLSPAQFPDSSMMLPSYDLNQWPHLEHSPLENAPPVSSMDHPDMFGLGMAMDPMPQAVNDLDLSPPTAEGDFLFSYPDTSSFVIAGSSNSLLNFPETQDESGDSTYNQTSDSVSDPSCPPFVETRATKTLSFCSTVSDPHHSPDDTPASESLSLETMDDQKFKEYPVTRLKKNECIENGKFLCNNADCRKIFDKNRDRK
ncbi:hypothetical protein FGLOB1_1536 [Fusarium globosum]|uniref:Uncharacterized protein n=1 Tax=Fusarium globosum TaxID=78864 RepID=A0A8H5YWJ8_9HYPO|nr:hypothetical protein FGLOB1_1536 [Fusarium globosum]